MEHDESLGTKALPKGRWQATAEAFHQKELLRLHQWGRVGIQRIIYHLCAGEFVDATYTHTQIYRRFIDIVNVVVLQQKVDLQFISDVLLFRIHKSCKYPAAWVIKPLSNYTWLF